MGQFTSWLQQVCDYIEKKHFSDALCGHFSQIIERSLNSIFFHVIDNSYSSEKSKAELQEIHDGESL